jgi:hypothetical protein
MKSMKAPRKQKEDASLRAFKKRLETVLAGYTPPTLEEMLKQGEKLFGPRPRSRKSATPGKAGPERRGAAVRGRPYATTRTRSVNVVRHDNPEDGRSTTQTLPALLSNIKRALPRRRSDPDITFCVGGKRTYLCVATQGPTEFSGQYPVWRGQRFEGCILFSLRWADVRAILRKFYEDRGLTDCFTGHDGSFSPYEG